jgi:hypothetical protein
MMDILDCHFYIAKVLDETGRVYLEQVYVIFYVHRKLNFNFISESPPSAGCEKGKSTQ